MGHIPKHVTMKRTILPMLLFCIQQLLAQPQQADPAEAYHDFDFWLGSWEVYKYGTDTLVGHSKIESVIDSVGLLENYSVNRGTYRGKSLNKYNPATERWEQYWIDNSGLTLFLSGGLVEGRMVLDDVEHGDADRGLNRIVWENMENGSVRQTWSMSQDGGSVWKVVFDGEYKMKNPEVLGLRTCIYKVDDMERAKKWYATAFGVDPYWDEPYYVGFNIGGYELGLLLQEDPIAEKAEGVITYWGVEDMEHMYKHLIESGATGHEKPHSVGDPLMVATVKDPWGNVVGLIYNPVFKLP
jgi:predicted enzyme related to lactoylglutathione lyase